MWKRKRTLKEEYGTLGHFLRGDNDCHYLGDLYIEGTNFYRHREWRGVRDTAYAFARWLQTWVKMAGLIGRDPVRMVRAFWKYRWLSAYLATPMMVDKWIEGDRGMVLRADLTAIDCMVSDSITTMWREIRADRRFGENKWTVFINGGRVNMQLDLVDWVKQCEQLGAGEICLNSIDTDGVRGGFDLPMLKAVCDAVQIPVIASGGAGKLSDFADAFLETGCSAALAASLFHFRELTVQDVKADCRAKGIPMR